MRYIMLDRITELRPPELARGVKCVTLADDVFADHFPGLPVMPGALILEAMAQLGGTLLEASLRERGAADESRADQSALLTMIDRAKFRVPVRPGDRIELEARTTTLSDDGGQVACLGRVDERLVCQAELSFAFVAVHNERLRASRREYLRILLEGSSE